MRKIGQLIGFVPTSEEAECLHEAGHAYAALIVGRPPVFMEFTDDPSLPGRARTRITTETEFERRLVACGGFAIEYKLHKSGRLTDKDGVPIDDQAFLQKALGNNAALDKVSFFGSDHEQENGCWPKDYDWEFLSAGKTMSDALSMDCVFVLAEALLNERRLDREQIQEIAKPYLANRITLKPGMRF